MSHDARGAKQPHRFDPKKAAMLDDPARFEYLPPAEIEALIDVPPGALVADFGTGTGLYALELAKHRPDISVAAIDEQDQMLGFLRAKLAASPTPNVRAVLSGTPEALALAGRVDRVLALNVLHELGDDALSGIASLLRPEGRALFIDWNASVERPFGPPQDHVYSSAEARERLGSVGWTVGREKSFRYHYALVAGPSRLRP